MSSKSLFRSSFLISSAILVSRILGFIRDIVISSLFGTGLEAQAFFVAFRIPNMLRHLIGEGATNAAVVPALTEILVREGKREFWRLSIGLFYVFVSVSLLLLVLSIVFSPYIIRLIAPGFILDVDKLTLTIVLHRLIAPYIILIGISAYSIAVLNSLGSFGVAVWPGISLNICLILSSILLTPYMGIYSLVAGLFLGAVLQVGIQIYAVYSRYKENRHIRSLPKRKRWALPLFHPKIRYIIYLLIPRLLGSCIYQVNIFVDTVLSSLSSIVGAGGVAALYYANRIFQFPLALFGISIATAALPRMSSYKARGDLASLNNLVFSGLSVVFLISIPASVGLCMLARPIVRLLFQRGEFGLYSTSITSTALFFYSFGLSAYAGIKVLTSALHSLQDTRTPVKIAGVFLIMNIILNLILMYPLKIGGLSLATSISATGNFLVLFYILRKRTQFTYIRQLSFLCLKIVAATILMAGFIQLFQYRIPVLVLMIMSISIYLLSLRCLDYPLSTIGFMRKGG